MKKIKEKLKVVIFVEKILNLIKLEIIVTSQDQLIALVM